MPFHSPSGCASTIKEESTPSAPTQACFAKAPVLHIPDAARGWSLLMQHSVFMPCTVGISAKDLMLQDLAIPHDLAIRRIDVIFLDGMPLDDLNTVIPYGGRVAFAAGLPGIAGLAMKKNSAIRALRPGITHTHSAAANPKQGFITLALYSLALPMLAEHILSRGVYIKADTLKIFFETAKDGPCIFDGQPLGSAVVCIPMLEPDSLVHVRAQLRVE